MCTYPSYTRNPTQTCSTSKFTDTTHSFLHQHHRAKNPKLSTQHPHTTQSLYRITNSVWEGCTIRCLFALKVGRKHCCCQITICKQCTSSAKTDTNNIFCHHEYIIIIHTACHTYEHIHTPNINSHSHIITAI